MRSIGNLGVEDRTKEHIPVSLKYLLYYGKATFRWQKKSALREPGNFRLQELMNYIRPNLKEPVFAIGAPRSGTTFLGARLAQLPELVYFLEPVLTKAAVRHVFADEWSERKAALIYRAVYAWLMRVRREPAAVFCEKTPGNCFIIPFLHRTFPDARFIHIVRDGRDSALSLSKKNWYANESKVLYKRDPDGYLFGPGRRFWVEPDRVNEYEKTNDLHRCIWLWRRYVESALEGLEAVPGAQVLQVRYEDLLRDTDRYGNDVLDHLSIDKPTSRDRFLQNLRETAHTHSVGAWRRSLSSNEAAELWEEGGRLMEDLGYARY